MTCALVSGRPRATLLEVVSCATLECKVMCISMETRSYAILGSKVVCDLRVQVAHEGSNYIECTCIVEMELTELDIMLSMELNN